MSYDLSIVDPDDDTVMLMSEHLPSQGGTHVLGGTLDAEFNITFNYSPYFRMLLGKKGLKTLRGKTAEDTVPILKEAIGRLNKADRSDDYWEPCENNVRNALVSLLHMARECPGGVGRSN